MSSYKLALGHIGDKARVTSCLLVNRLLLLFYVLVVCHSITQILPASLVKNGRITANAGIDLCTRYGLAVLADVPTIAVDSGCYLVSRLPMTIRHDGIRYRFFNLQNSNRSNFICPQASISATYFLNSGVSA